MKLKPSDALKPSIKLYFPSKTFSFIVRRLFRWRDQIVRRRQLRVLLRMHFLLVRVHVGVALEGSRAERTAVDVDSGVLRAMLDEVRFVLENFPAMFAAEPLRRVDVSDVRLQRRFVLELLVALRTWVRPVVLLFVFHHVDSEAPFVLQKVTAKAALDGLVGVDVRLDVSLERVLRLVDVGADVAHEGSGVDVTVVHVELQLRFRFVLAVGTLRTWDGRFQLVLFVQPAVQAQAEGAAELLGARRAAELAELVRDVRSRVDREVLPRQHRLPAILTREHRRIFMPRDVVHHLALPVDLPAAAPDESVLAVLLSIVRRCVVPTQEIFRTNLASHLGVLFHHLRRFLRQNGNFRSLRSFNVDFPRFQLLHNFRRFLRFKLYPGGTDRPSIIDFHCQLQDVNIFFHLHVGKFAALAFYEIAFDANFVESFHHRLVGDVKVELDSAEEFVEVFELLVACPTDNFQLLRLAGF